MSFAGKTLVQFTSSLAKLQLRSIRKCPDVCIHMLCRTDNKPSGNLDFELPYNSKLLLLAAYIASRNRPASDRKLFDNTAGKRKRKNVHASDWQVVHTQSCVYMQITGHCGSRQSPMGTVAIAAVWFCAAGPQHCLVFHRCSVPLHFALQSMHLKFMLCRLNVFNVVNVQTSNSGTKLIMLKCRQKVLGRLS